MSAPGLPWDAMVSMAKIELEILSDADMYLFFDEGMRSRVSYVSKRYSKANNKYLNCYGTKQESKHNTYLACKYYILSVIV